MMPEMPAWAARLLLYVVVGSALVLGVPLLGWIGRREIARWEGKVQELESEIERMQRDRREEHEQVEEMLEQVLEEVQ
jgi:hypothetical protein